MLVEWYSWVCSLRVDELLMVLGVLLLVDAPRYAYSVLGMALWDIVKYTWTGTLPGPGVYDSGYQPSVTVVIAGHNEADTIQQTMQSVLNGYPNVQLIVVDDGSTDGMAAAAPEFAHGKPEITVLRSLDRSGKSSALNMGLAHATGEILVTVDADSRLG